MPELKLVANDMLPVYESDMGERIVSARELHEKLMSKKDFTSWMKIRIENYGFIEGEDFTPIWVKSNGGRPSRDYYLQLDTAKEVAMVEHTEQGRAVRKYFIEVEKKFRQQEQPKMPTHAEALRGWADAIEDKHLLEQTIEEQKPKVVYADAVQVSRDSVLVKDLANVLKQNGVDTGPTRLFRWLRDSGYLCRKHGDMWNMPTQRSLDLGVIGIKHGLRTDRDGEMKKTRTPVITGKGQIYFLNKLLPGKEIELAEAK